jgi:hypothetical protein
LGDLQGLRFVVAVLAVRRVAGTRKPAVPRILGSFQGLQDQQRAAGIVFHDTASALFGVAGLRVTDVGAGPDGAVEVWAVTDHEGAACCPECGTGSSRVHDLVTCPRDVRRGDDPVSVRWVKRRLKCENADCPRRTFTERAPAVPSGHRLTPRLREQCAAEVAGRGITLVRTA